MGNHGKSKSHNFYIQLKNTFIFGYFCFSELGSTFGFGKGQ